MECGKELKPVWRTEHPPQFKPNVLLLVTLDQYASTTSGTELGRFQNSKMPSPRQINLCEKFKCDEQQLDCWLTAALTAIEVGHKQSDPVKCCNIVDVVDVILTFDIITSCLAGHI